MVEKTLGLMKLKMKDEFSEQEYASFNAPSEEDVAKMKAHVKRFARYDHRALTRRIKPQSLDIICRKLLETCTPDSTEAEIINALGTIALSRTVSHLYSIREMESLLNRAWTEAAKTNKAVA
jgi:hypothetical protein